MNTTAAEANETTRSLKYITDYIGPFNAAILLGMTLVDLTTPQLQGGTARWLALAIAMAVLALAFRLRQLARARQRQGDTRPLAALFFRDRRHWLAIAAIGLGLVLLGSHLSASATHGRGLLASSVPGLAGVQDGLTRLLQRTEAIQADTAVIRAAVAPDDPRGRLRTLGYGLDAESKARALEACDLVAVQHYLALGEPLPLTAPVMGQRGGSSLERPLLEQHPRLPALIALLAAHGQRFDEPQPLTFTQAMTRQIPDFEALRRRLKDPVQRPALQPAVTQATPLVLALWFGHEAAARALVAAGASTTAPGVVAQLPAVARGLPTGGFTPVPLATASEVAAQLQRGAWLQ